MPAVWIAVRTRFGRAASLGLAAGLLFADGDISAKLVGYGGVWLAAVGTLIVAYAARVSRAARQSPGGARFRTAPVTAGGCGADGAAEVTAEPPG